MKIEELRIGNIISVEREYRIRDTNGSNIGAKVMEVVAVDGIIGSTVCFDTGLSADCTRDISACFGVPLDEDWILKSQFIHHFEVDEDYICRTGDGTEVTLSKRGDGYKIRRFINVLRLVDEASNYVDLHIEPIKYVHELQNKMLEIADIKIEFED